MERIIRNSVAFSLLLALAGCGHDERASPQVAARVNGHEISVAQIDSALARSGNIPPEQLKKTSPQALEKIIDQQLLVQKAVETKLDREPQIARALDNARSQILAQAYVDRATAATGKARPEEVQAYYDKNPALFAQRRIYHFEEIGAVVADDKIEPIAKIARKAGKLSEVGAWFKTQNIPFNTTESTKSAEELSLEFLPWASKMRDGQIVLIPGKGRVAILQLTRSQSAPLDVYQAAPQIEQFFLGRKRFELAQGEIKKLRDAAKIEYVGEFIATKPADAAAATTAQAAGGAGTAEQAKK